MQWLWRRAAFCLAFHGLLSSPFYITGQAAQRRYYQTYAEPFQVDHEVRKCLTDGSSAENPYSND